MAGASFVAAYSLARLATGVTVATLVTALVGTVVVAVLRRHQALAVASGVAAVAVSAVWWGVRSWNGSGDPAVGALRGLRRSLRAARPVLDAFALPLVHSPGMVVLCALFGGLVAVAARAVGTRHPALSLVPAGALLVGSAVLLPATGAAVAGLALGACGFLVLADGPGAVTRASSGVAVVALALAATTMGWVAVAGSDVASPGGDVVDGVAPSALSLATDLTGVESRDADVVLFTAKTPVPTYWQVATLTTYVGDRWVPDQATTALLRGSAPALPAVRSGDRNLFTAAITVLGYSGRLLPSPPSTVAATGSVSPVVTPLGVVAGSPVHLGSGYTVTATVPSPVSDTPSDPTATGTSTALGPLPPVVSSLARSVTAGFSSPLDKAEALTDFFRSGRFRYDVDARQPTGVDPLVSFLTQTRTGSCEQFAGAFAVLARASGLPTRVAVGFTPGRQTDGESVVRGSDAHAWPEVLIGGNWVSFEPTPQLPSGELSPPGVLGPAGLGQPAPVGPGTQPHVTVPVTTPSPTVPPPTVPAPPVTRPDGIGTSWMVAAIVLLVAAVAAAVVMERRRRVRGGPADRVMAAWTSIDRALARKGMPRAASSTPMGHIRALARRSRTDQGRAALEDMTTVAIELQNAAYGSLALAPEEVERAERAGERARRAILDGALSGPRVDDPVVPGRTRTAPGSRPR
ncbi:MAG: transglutaminaseTgpA domain-containing protein [Acidimicrobiales bacterium]